jgi:diguanylate cyclase (GGDEF)-like protein/PAS domain S-box-containing protein
VDSDRARVSSQLVRLAMRSGRWSWVANLAFAVLFALVYWREKQAPEAMYWCAALAVLLLARVLFCAEALAKGERQRPSAPRIYAVFAVAEGMAWAFALAGFAVADPAGFLLQFTLTLGVTIGMLLPFGAVPVLWLLGVTPLAAAQAYAISAAVLPNPDLVVLVWASVLGLGAFACLALYLEVKATRLKQLHDEQAALIQDQAMAELNASREQLRLALEAIDAGVADFDVATGKRSYSVRFTDMLGHGDRATFRREFDLAEALHPDDRDEVLEARRAHLEGGAPFRREFRLRNARGEYIWVQARGESLRDAAGRATRFVISIVDITKRREAEVKLVASERRYRALVDATPSLIWTCDRAGKITLVSARACRMIYGYEPRHVIGRHVTAVNAPGFSRRMFMRRFLPVFRGRPVFDVEVEHQARDGRRLYVSVSAIPTFNAEGELDSVLGVCTDITAARHREHELAVALRNQQVIFDAAGEGIAVVQDGRIVEANGALARMLSVSRGWLDGRAAADIVADAAEWRRIVAGAQAAAHRGESANQEVVLRAGAEGNAGRGVWAQLTARAVGADGDAETLILVLTDITPLKQREEMAWHQANHDELTGLPNRRLLVENARRLLSVAMRRDRIAALMVLDLDGFKAVNDAYGHAWGDAMLRRVSMRMSMVLREYDLIARHGGDEFVILLPEIDDVEAARTVAEKLITAAGEDVEIDGVPMHLGASIGIAVFPADGQDFDALLRRADAAMYVAKQAGKNRFAFATPALDDRLMPAGQPVHRPH